MFISYRLVGNKKSVIDKDAYDYYTQNSKKRDKSKINQNRHFAKIINSIYKKVAENAVTYEGGIYAKEMFYIIPQPYPQKLFVRLTDGETLRGTMNLHTDNKIYSIFFVNLFPGTKYKCWDMYNSFFKNIKSRLSEILHGGSAKYIYSLNYIFNTRKRK